MSHMLLARQPIYSADLDVVAYELLFRPVEAIIRGEIDGDAATSTVLSHAFLDDDIGAVLGPHCAYVNFTASLLRSGVAALLPKERLVVEILEDVVVDAEVIEATRALVADGYTVALDDFIYSPVWDPLLELAQVVKLDVQCLGLDGVRQHVALLRRFGVKILAEKVETQEEFEACRQAGCTYFQGYFLCRPTPVCGAGIKPSRLHVVTLLGRVMDPNVSLQELDGLVRQDPTLSYRLLRLINAAAWSLGRKVSSTRQALALLGLDRIRKWISLSLLASVDDRPRALVVQAMVRASHAELLARAAGRDDSETYFVLGLFSMMPALLERELDEVLLGMPLPDPMRWALLRGEGPLADVLECVLCHERGDFRPQLLASVSQEAQQDAWLQAVSWAAEAAAAVAERGQSAA